MATDIKGRAGTRTALLHGAGGSVERCLKRRPCRRIPCTHTSLPCDPPLLQDTAAHAAALPLRRPPAHQWRARQFRTAGLGRPCLVGVAGGACKPGVGTWGWAESRGRRAGGGRQRKQPLGGGGVALRRSYFLGHVTATASCVARLHLQTASCRLAGRPRSPARPGFAAAGSGRLCALPLAPLRPGAKQRRRRGGGAAQRVQQRRWQQQGSAIRWCQPAAAAAAAGAVVAGGQGLGPGSNGWQ